MKLVTEYVCMSGKETQDEALRALEAKLSMHLRKQSDTDKIFVPLVMGARQLNDSNYL